MRGKTGLIHAVALLERTAAKDLMEDGSQRRREFKRFDDINPGEELFIPMVKALSGLDVEVVGGMIGLCYELYCLRWSTKAGPFTRVFSIIGASVGDTGKGSKSFVKNTESHKITP